MHTLFNLFGAPEDVAFRHTLTRAPYALMLSWIRCAEAMLRRLLLIEAAAFPKPNTRPLLHPQRKRARKLVGFDCDKPEAWRVSFRTLERGRPRPQGRRPKLRAGTPALHTFFSAWPLAERYEALIRVFNNPEPFARRLAKRLHACAHRIGELLRAPAEAQHRVESFAPMRELALARWRRPCPDTS